MPLGIVVGRVVWTAIANDLGIASIARVPVLALLVALLVAVLLANLVAALPARSAARTRPALELRSE